MSLMFVLLVVLFVGAVVIRDVRDPGRRASALHFTHNRSAVAVGLLVAIVVLGIGLVTGTALGSATECVFGGLLAAALFDRIRPDTNRS
jgi:glycerol uptake facilitator-like aquaporin